MIPVFKVFMAPNALDYVGPTLHSGYIGEGPRVQEFERGVTAALGWTGATSQSVLAVNSCTAALDLAAHLIGIRAGDEVISTPMTCAATNTVLVNRGARILWADVDPVTGLIDPRDVQRKVSAHTKAIVAVDWAGRPCDYHELARHGIPVIQDAAHNFYVDEHNRGDYVAWSFQAIKHLTTGDGGALLVPNPEYERARLLRWYGLDRTSSADFRCEQDIPEAGYKYHMNDLAASIGLANLPSLRNLVERGRDNAVWFWGELEGVRGLVCPPWTNKSSWWLYTVLVRNRDSFRAHLLRRGIATSMVHRRNDEFSSMHFPSGRLPGVDSFSSHQVAIPVGWWVGDRERLAIAAAIWEWSHSEEAQETEVLNDAESNQQFEQARQHR